MARFFCFLLMLPVVVTAQEAPAGEETSAAEPMIAVSIAAPEETFRRLYLGAEMALVGFGPCISPAWELSPVEYLGFSAIPVYSILMCDCEGSRDYYSRLLLTVDYELVLGKIVYFNPCIGVGYAFGFVYDEDFRMTFFSRLTLGVGVALGDVVGLELQPGVCYEDTLGFSPMLGLGLNFNL